MLLSLRSRLVLLLTLFATLALASVGVGLLLQDHGTRVAGELYQREVMQARIVEGISRRITLIDADIAGVAIGFKPPLDAYEYLRRNRPLVEKMFEQLRSQYQVVSGERRDMLDAIDHNLPDFNRLIDEISRAYIAGNTSAVGALFHERWPIMRYSILGPLDRLLFLQQNELDQALLKMNEQGRRLRLMVLFGLAVCLALGGLIAWRLWCAFCKEQSEFGNVLARMAGGHAPVLSQIRDAAVRERVDALWQAMRMQKEYCTDRDIWLNRHRLMQELVKDGICCLDREGHLLHANPAAHSLLPDGDACVAGRWPDLLEKAHQQGEAHSTDESLRDREGRERPVELTVRYCPTGEADAAYLLRVHDLTDALRKEGELLQAYHSIKQLHDELASIRKELLEIRQLAFVGRIAAVLVTPINTQLHAIEAAIDQLEPQANLAEMQALRKGLAEIRRLVAGLNDNSAGGLPKAQAGGLE